MKALSPTPEREGPKGPGRYPSAPACTTGDSGTWSAAGGGYGGNNSVVSPSAAVGQSNWMQTQVEGAGTFSFWWKSPSTDVFSTLRFEIDGQPQATLEGDHSTWQQQTYTLTGSGTHTLKWTFTRSSHAEWSGSGYVDRVQWTGALPAGSAPPLRFYVDGVLRSTYIGGSWENFSYSITGSGPHTLRWLFKRSSSDWSGTGSVDYVQWTGYVEQPPAPEEPTPEDWRILRYVYDASGRRIEKKYDDTTQVRYVYDGDQCLAEYDSSNQLLRKYIYGPGIDQPICLIESSGSYAGTYYYHFDGLGSVVALTSGNVGSMGNTVEVYEYDIYGRVGALDADHPNRFMFTGREYDKETGLYYYRARYYNPQIGRFLQTDPIGYGDGLGWYAYCGNSPTGCTDPSGQWASLTAEWITRNGTTALEVKCWADAAQTQCGMYFFFTGWDDLADYISGAGKYGGVPGDFCDVEDDTAAARRLMTGRSGPDPTSNPSARSGPDPTTTSGSPGREIAPGITVMTPEEAAAYEAARGGSAASSSSIVNGTMAPSIFITFPPGSYGDRIMQALNDGIAGLLSRST